MAREEGRISLAKCRQNSCLLAKRSFNRQWTRIYTGPSVVQGEESLGRSPEHSDGIANGDARPSVFLAEGVLRADKHLLTPTDRETLSRRKMMVMAVVMESLTPRQRSLWSTSLTTTSFA